MYNRKDEIIHGLCHSVKCVAPLYGDMYRAKVWNSEGGASPQRPHPSCAPVGLHIGNINTDIVMIFGLHIGNTNNIGIIGNIIEMILGLHIGNIIWHRNYCGFTYWLYL